MGAGQKALLPRVAVSGSSAPLSDKSVSDDSALDGSGLDTSFSSCMALASVAVNE